MEYIKKFYQRQIDFSRAEMKKAYDFSNERPLKYICDACWWLFGQLPERIPENYCKGDYESMYHYQLELLQKHYEKGWGDCMEPILSPWYGTGVLPSGFGSQVAYKKGMDPAVEMRSDVDENFVKNMKIPDPYKDGQMPMVLETIDFFREKCDLDINLTDLQGPLSSAFNLVGYENFIYWMYDEPELVHELMEKVTEALIMWIRVQKRQMGIPDEEPSSMMHIRGLDGKGGVFIADDEEVLMNAEDYAEFAKPYNEKLFDAFGGGGLHCCGNVAHQAENLKNTKGLTIYHNMLLNDFEHAAVTQEVLAQAGIPYVAGDFNPSDEGIDEYYEGLLKTLKPKGLIVASYIAPAAAMVKGKYITARRNSDEVAERINKIMEEKMKKYF